MGHPIIHWSCIGSLVLTLVPATAKAQFRLDQFTNADPTRAALQLSTGALVLAMEVEDSTFLWMGDNDGTPLWARSIVGIGDRLQLIEDANANTMLVEMYYPTSEEVSSWEDLVTQEFRVSKISDQGAVTWSNRFTLTFTQPYEFSIQSGALQAIATVDGGMLISILNFSSGPGTLNVCHVLRVAEDGSVAWCKRMGQMIIDPYIWIPDASYTSQGLLLTELPNGNFAMMLDKNDPPWNIDVHMIDANGTPLVSAELDYTGAVIYRHMTSLTTTPAGDILVAGRMSTLASPNIMTFQLDPDLAFIDGDAYWGLNTSVNPALSAVAYRSDGNRVLLVDGVGPDGYTYLLEVDEEGAIIAPHWSAPLPYVDDQTMLVRPKHLRYDDEGIRLAHTLFISHPVLGNLGHFSERSFIEPGVGNCYFSEHPVGHVQVPDSLVSIGPLSTYTTTDVVVAVTADLPLTNHSLITTVQGCEFQIGVPERAGKPLFDLVTNTVPNGMGLQLRAAAPFNLSVFDAQGRIVVNNVRSPGGQWTLPLPDLSPGVYSVTGSSGGNMPTTLRFLVH